MKLLLAASQRRKISALEMALRRLRTGNFGICAECEEQTSENRLIAKPESLCVSIARRKWREKADCG